MERKYELKLKESQDYFEKTLHQKVIEIEENVCNYYEKIREEGLLIEKKAQIYEENYISQAEFEETMAEKDSFISVLGRKMKEFETSAEALSQKNGALLAKLKDY